MLRKIFLATSLLTSSLLNSMTPITPVEQVESVDFDAERVYADENVTICLYLIDDAKFWGCSNSIVSYFKRQIHACNFYMKNQPDNTYIDFEFVDEWLNDILCGLHDEIMDAKEIACDLEAASFCGPHGHGRVYDLVEKRKNYLEKKQYYKKLRQDRKCYFDLFKLSCK